MRWQSFVRSAPLRDVSGSLVQGSLEVLMHGSLSNSGFLLQLCRVHWHGESMSRLRSLTSRLARSAFESLCRIGVVAPRLPSNIKELACHLFAVQHPSGHRQYTSRTLVRQDCGQRSAVTWTLQRASGLFNLLCDGGHREHADRQPMAETGVPLHRGLRDAPCSNVPQRNLGRQQGHSLCVQTM